MTGFQQHKRVSRALAAGVCAAALVAIPGRAEAQNAAFEWNQIAAQLIVVGSQSPVQQTRLMAIVHVAMHDAVSGITGGFEQYIPAAPGPAAVSPQAAAIGAAHRALQGAVGPSMFLETSFMQSLEAHGLSSTDPSVAFGAAVADGILARRQHDGASSAAYAFIPENAGDLRVWVPLGTQVSLLPGWGQVAPFVLRSASQFRPDPPPALDSEQYAKDYNEVKIIGASNSPLRTTEQTQIAQFWLASPTAIWNPVMRQVVATRDLDLSDKARAYALFYLAASDASVACWDAKYTYNYWRPQPAIRNGHLDGNDLTETDPTWSPLHPTPRHPEYTSGHATNSSAMASILALLFGDNPGAPIEVTLSGIARRWDTF